MKAVIDAARAAAAEAASTATAPAGEATAETEVGELHPLLRRTQAKLAAAAGKGIDLIQISGKGLFTVTVSPGQIDRLARLLSQLVGAVEGRGWTTEDGEAGLRLVPDS